MIKAATLLTPIYVTLFWSIVFLSYKKEYKHPKLYLGILMLMALLLYTSHAIFFSKLYSLYSYIESIYIFTMLSIYPLYYSYILLRSGKIARFNSQLKHFWPALILFILAFTTTFFLTAEERIFYVRDILIQKNIKGLSLTSMIVLKGIILFTAKLIFLLQVVYYAFKGITTANEYNKKVANYYSNIEGKTLHWVRDLNVVILVVAAASISFTIIGRSYFSRHEVSLIFPSFIFSSVLFYMGFKGNQQTELLEEIVEENDSIVEFEEIKSENVDKLRDQLIELFENHKSHTNPDLRITTISEKLGTNRTYISRLINEEFEMNFNEFVNKYRLNEAKKMLSSINNNIYTIEHIAEKSGFGSAASFSRVFKDYEGLTPSKYRTNQQNIFNNKSHEEKKEIASG